jgi:hypothetical protein
MGQHHCIEEQTIAQLLLPANDQALLRTAPNSHEVVRAEMGRSGNSSPLFGPLLLIST